MFCPYCGANLTDNAKFCSSCGAQIEKENTSEVVTETNNQLQTNQPTPNTQSTVKKFSGAAIAGFVLSLVGIIVAGIPCGVLGIIFSAAGMSETKNQEKRGKGLAIAGLVISIIDIVLVLSMF